LVNIAAILSQVVGYAKRHFARNARSRYNELCHYEKRFL